MKRNEKKKPKTLIELINDTESGIPMESAKEQSLIGKKRRSSVSEKTLSQPRANQSDLTHNNNISITNQQQEQSRYQNMLKPKIFLVDGKMQIQKPNISLINKQINEEISKNAIPLMTYNENKRITSLSFKDIHHTNKWNSLENKLFYKAIEVFGLDFSFLEIVLQPRKRGEIKRKYLKEEKINSQLVDKIINSKKNIEKMFEILTVYKRQDIDEKNKIEEFHNILLKKRKGNKMNDDKIQEMIQELTRDKGNYYAHTNVIVEDDNEKMENISEEKEDENDEEEIYEDKNNNEPKDNNNTINQKTKDNNKELQIKKNDELNNDINSNKNEAEIQNKETDEHQIFVNQILQHFG